MPPRRFRSPQEKLGNGSLALFFPANNKNGLSPKPSWTEQLSILRRPVSTNFSRVDLRIYKHVCCGSNGVPFFQKPPHQQHVFFKVPFEIAEKNIKNELVEQTTHFTTSFRGRFCMRACVDNASRKNTIFESEMED